MGHCGPFPLWNILLLGSDRATVSHELITIKREYLKISPKTSIDSDVSRGYSGRRLFRGGCWTRKAESTSSVDEQFDWWIISLYNLQCFRFSSAEGLLLHLELKSMALLVYYIIIHRGCQAKVFGWAKSVSHEPRLLTTLGIGPKINYCVTCVKFS